jgi:hypothetical protein
VGAFSSTSGAQVTWTPPQNTTGYYSITCKVSDGKGEDEKSIYIQVSDNASPVISSVTAEPSSADPGASVTLTCNATDSDNDSLTYYWLASTGRLSSASGATTTWTAPNVAADYSISCMVNDPTYNMAFGQVTVTVKGNASTEDAGEDDAGVADSGGMDASALPSGFPQNLPQGDYDLSYSMTMSVNGVAPTTTGPTSVGSLVNQGDVNVFASSIMDGLNQAAAQYTQQGCQSSTSSTPFDGTKFTCSLKIQNCNISGIAMSIEVIYTITKK